jgi:hypothetical protein
VTVSKYQISNREHGECQQDTGGHGDRHPTAKSWARSGEAEKVRGEVWWIESIGWQRMIRSAWHEDTLASSGDSGVAMYRNSTHQGDWPILQHRRVGRWVGRSPACIPRCGWERDMFDGCAD